MLWIFKENVYYLDVHSSKYLLKRKWITKNKSKRKQKNYIYTCANSLLAGPNIHQLYPQQPSKTYSLQSRPQEKKEYSGPYTKLQLIARLNLWTFGNIEYPWFDINPRSTSKQSSYFFLHFFKWHINFPGLYNAKAIVVEEEWKYYLTHSWRE